MLAVDERLEGVTISTKQLDIGRIDVRGVTVDMVKLNLNGVFGNEPTTSTLPAMSFDGFIKLWPNGWSG